MSRSAIPSGCTHHSFAPTGKSGHYRSSTDSRAFRRYFCDNWIPFSNVCYAFLDYLPALQTDIRRICHTYRLAEPSVMRIPYNIRFREAVRSGQSHDYLKEELPQYKTTDFHLCIQELTRSGKLILKTLDENLLIRSNGFKNVHHI